VIALAGKIEAPGSIELHLIAALPPGIDPMLMEANMMASTAVAINLTPYIRGFFVEMHDVGPEQVKQQYDERMKKGPKLI
jgi:hypothetical protein